MDFCERRRRFLIVWIQKPWVNAKGQWVLGLEIFYEEGLILKQAPVQCASAQSQFLTKGDDQDTVVEKRIAQS